MQYADPFAAASGSASPRGKGKDARARKVEGNGDMADVSTQSEQMTGPREDVDEEAQHDQEVDGSSDRGEEDELLRRQEVIQRRAKLLARLQEAKNQLLASPSSSTTSAEPPPPSAPLATTTNDDDKEDTLPARARELREKLLKSKLLLGKREEEMRRKAKEARLKCVLKIQRGRREGKVEGVEA